MIYLFCGHFFFSAVNTFFSISKEAQIPKLKYYCAYISALDRMNSQGGVLQELLPFQISTAGGRSSASRVMRLQTTAKLLCWVQSSALHSVNTNIVKRLILACHYMLKYERNFSHWFIEAHLHCVWHPGKCDYKTDDNPIMIGSK